MLTIEECKKTLGKEAENLKDDEIIQIRDWLYFMADIAINAIDNNQFDKQKEL